MTLLASLDIGYFHRCQRCGLDKNRPQRHALYCFACSEHLIRQRDARWQRANGRRTHGYGEHRAIPAWRDMPDALRTTLGFCGGPAWGQPTPNQEQIPSLDPKAGRGLPTAS